jgi:ABC-type multidrug transport system fused ATPase/permease subunit
MTRFSKDLVVLDQILTLSGSIFTIGVFRCISVAILICVISPWVLLPLVVILILMYFIHRKAELTMTETQKYDSKFRGPIH